MTDVEAVQNRYMLWFDKMQKNLSCTKGAAAKELLLRFNGLTLVDDLIGYRQHSRTLARVVEEYSNEKPKLHWLQKLARDCTRWVTVFESTVSIKGLDTNTVVQALESDRLEIDEALGLIRCQ